MNPPLAVLRYLAELDAALADRGAPDRDQIVTQIGEHISQALGDRPDPSEAEIAAVLAELGDPLRIADEAAPPSSDKPEDPAPPVAYLLPPPKPALLARSWIPAVAVALWAIGASAALAPLLLVATSPVGGMPDGALLLSVVLNIPLVASIVLLFCSPLYRPPGRWVWLLSVPVAMFIELIVARGGVQHSPYPLDATIAWAIIIACPVGAVCAVVMITIRAYRRVPAVPPAPIPPPLAQPATR